MSDYAKIENTQDTRSTLGARLGFVSSSSLDELDRSKFNSDSEYLAAAAKLEVERSTPEYQAALRRVSAEYEKRREAEAQRVTDEQYRQLRKSVQLDAFEQSQVEKQARARAEADLGCGKISVSGLGAAISRYSDALTEQAKDRKAGNAAFNSMIRSKWRG